MFKFQLLKLSGHYFKACSYRYTCAGDQRISVTVQEREAVEN